ncbi:MAG: DUF2520 domain-containing protein [Prevotella sp.]|nr:DUF2520 domain-containing protein [Prevotella sp.]
MKVVLIGAGRLATNLGVALREAGEDIKQVYSRTMESADVLAAKTDAEAVTDISEITPDADIYIVSVKDSVLQTLIPQLCKGREERLFVHTAGSMPMDIFKGYARRYGVFYPMQTFSKERRADFRQITCFLEASDWDVMAQLHSVAESIGSRAMELDTERRRYLHLAAVFACNFANHCYDLAAEVLKRHDIPFDVMLPLIDETAAKVHSLSPSEAQTGPAVRYDRNVIGAQMQLLTDDPQTQQIYEQLSKSIHDKLQSKED